MNTPQEERDAAFPPAGRPGRLLTRQGLLARTELEALTRQLTIHLGI